MPSNEYLEALKQAENRYTAEEALDENPPITSRRAHQLCIQHDASWGEFLDDNGQHDTYGMGDVLAWLGY